MRFFIIHGAHGHSKENWFPWLKEKLIQLGHEVIIPDFPTPENQTLGNWINVFKENFNKIDSDTVLIGHSLGVAFILSVLEKINVKIKACFLVAGFIGSLEERSELNEINKTFAQKEFNFNKIKENCDKFFLFHSLNDPYVKIGKGEELKEKLHSELIIIEDAGHFGTKAGYSEFPQLFEKIKELK
ncbi:hypothetical protein CEE44_01405 [Candidatus Woesearchaeota archaeon B3_Woes]|nr:MAG: hypothetical protein CEE44_01405 [Candidatus Woesearchaeota archaeon B3_Woes]